MLPVEVVWYQEHQWMGCVSIFIFIFKGIFIYVYLYVFIYVQYVILYKYIFIYLFTYLWYTPTKKGAFRDVAHFSTVSEGLYGVWFFPIFFGDCLGMFRVTIYSGAVS